MSDLRLPGGTTSSIAEEVRAQSESGISTALVHAAGSITNYPNPWSSHIRRVLGHPGVRIASPRDQVHAKVLVIRHPTVIYSTQNSFAGISADHVIIVVNHAAVDAAGTWHYPVEATNARVRRLFDVDPEWAPIGPVVRQTVLEQTTAVPLRQSDWVNIFRTAGPVRRRTGFVADRPVIGRHSRPQPGKWPATGRDILLAYPDSTDYQVEILGGAQVAESKLGHVPTAWNVVEFGGEEPDHFLERIDFWVYMHHPDLKEAFGRAAMEALAAGCVAIMPPYMRELFGDAALYAAPRDVRGIVDEYAADQEKFLAQSARAQDFALTFSPEMHLRRLEEFGVYASEPDAARAPGEEPRLGGAPEPGLVLCLSVDADTDTADHVVEHLRTVENRRVLRAQIGDAPQRPVGTTPTVHVPTAAGLQAEEETWQRYLGRRLRRLVDTHRPGSVTVVGSDVPDALLQTLDWADVPAIWVRDGAGDQRTPDPHTAGRFRRILRPEDFTGSGVPARCWPRDGVRGDEQEQT